MRFWAKRLFGGLIILLLIAGLAGATYQWATSRRELAATPPPGELVDIGGYKLHIWCIGSGTPTVILETGLGGAMFDWGFVQPEVAKFTRVCSYDRAGIGYSDPSPAPRTSRQIARELGKLLQESRVEGYLVLVGASLGGFNIRSFTSENEDRVAGLVFVDSSHEDQRARYAAAGVPEELPQLAGLMPLAAFLGITRLAGMAPGLNPDSLAPSVRPFARAVRFRTSAFRTAINEFRDFDESSAQVRANRRDWTMPLIVLTAGQSGERSDLGEIWRDLQRSLVTSSSQGCQIVADRSHHAIGIEQPELVVNAIRVIVDAARNGGGRFTCSGEAGQTAQPAAAADR